jgi:transcriptional regulator GlxA family with amidase domain
VQIAIVLFERMTALDAVGPYDVFSRLPGVEVVFVGHEVGPVRTDVGSLGLHVDATLLDVTQPEIVLVPGGIGQQQCMTDEALHSWLRAVDAHSTWTTSVCTGSLVLGAAGLLQGRRATSHWVRRDELAHHGAIPTDERVVFDDKYVTAAGVSAGIDMALTLVERLMGPEAAQAVQLGIEYDPAPPFDTGHPDKADQAVIDFMLTYKDVLI